MNPFDGFPGLAEAQMKTRITSLEARLWKLEAAISSNQEANKRNFTKINQLLKDMGAAINRILGRMEG